ncbi:MAG: ferrous iron transport protein A [Alphaproteobacteria bacterium]|nr:ferrous iron transport protein A [Alphaproteobacteria bacterium]
MNRFHLHDLALNTPARIASIKWDSLHKVESQRLQAFGFEVGAQVEPLHRAGLFGRDPIAVRIGRMTVALRKAVASKIEVIPLRNPGNCTGCGAFITMFMRMCRA